MQTQNETMKAPEMFTNQESQQDQVEEQVTEQKEESKHAPIYLGAKKFETVDELARYTSELEQQKNQVSYQPVVQQSQEKPISELLFENPEKALELHEQRVIQKLKAEENKKQQEIDLWNRFYSNNKDLSEEREVVEFVLGKNWESLRHLHPDQAMEKLAEHSRGALARFRKAPEKNQELPSGQAKAGPTSARTVPTISEKKAEPVDFVSQLRKIQSKRK